MSAKGKDKRVVIDVQGLWAGYNGHVVLEDVDLQVLHGDFIGLIGPNGGGKSTLLKVLLGLIEPMRGTVRIMGDPVKRGRRHIGYVPQSASVDPAFPVDVWDVVCMGRLGKRRLFRSYTSQDRAIVAEKLRQVEMYAHRDRPIGALSGGQRQRTYIARALAAEPEILLLDEPTASIDPSVSASIYELLHQLNERVTIMMVSHDMMAISSYVKTIGCLNRHLHYHGSKELTPDMVDAAYECPVDLIAHGVPHRVFPQHDLEGES